MTHRRSRDSIFVRLARLVRHAPGLRRLEVFWRSVRPAYHRVLDRAHRRLGIPLSLGSAGIMHVPASFVRNQVDPLELPMIARLRSVIEPTTCFYDLGASIGLHSLVVGENLRLGGAIHAFEPEQESTREFWTNTRLLRDRGIPIQLHRCFVAERSVAFSPNATRVEFIAGELAGRSGRTRHLYLAETAPTEHCPAVALDDYVTGRVRPPTVIKCDIEGAELLFLRGAARVLGAYHPLLFLSVHPALLPAFGHTPDEVYAWLQLNGYRWELIDDVGEIHLFAAKA